jgi:hypothetical protein
MRASGWTHGREFDPAAHTHDAIVPFEELLPADQHSVVSEVMTGDLLESLTTLPQYGRGHERELTASDVRVGTRVVYRDEVAEKGTIVNLQLDPNWPGCLEAITVRWDSGETHDYAPGDGELCVETADKSGVGRGSWRFET